MKRITTFIKDYQRSHDSGTDKTRTHALSSVLVTLLTTLQKVESSEFDYGQSVIYQGMMIPELADILMQVVVRKVSFEDFWS